MSDLMRAAIESILPPGAAWQPAPDGDLDKMFDGMAENWETIRLFLEQLSDVRNPKTTIFLEDLEKEFGVFSNETQTEAERRAILTPRVFARESNGSVDAMQAALDSAEFDVIVTENNPAVDPNFFLNQTYEMVCGGETAVCGNENAFIGTLPGELLVNGNIFIREKDWISVCGDEDAVCGLMTCGEFSGISARAKAIYPVPTDPDDWPMVFFVSGPVTRDGGGNIIKIEVADVPIVRRSDFERIILQFKPIHSWAALIVQYTA